MPIIPSGATHFGPKTGNYFKLLSITPFKVMRWAGTKWVKSDYTFIGKVKFDAQVKRIKPKFKGNTYDTAILS